MHYSVFLVYPAFGGSVPVGQHITLYASFATPSFIVFLIVYLSYVTAMLVAGWYLAFMFQVAHVVPDLDW